MKHLLTFVLALSICNTNSYSKEIIEKMDSDIIDVNVQNNNTFQIETDPIAWAMGGGSIHGAYNFSRHRFQIGLAFLTLPEGLQENDGITENFKSVSIKYDYFFNNREDNGWFTGSTIDLLFWEYEDEYNQKIKTESVNLGIRAGYKYVPFDSNSSLGGLYMTPWIGVSFMMNNDDLEFESGIYERSPIKVFPTIHIGWEF